jgi:hypothetical protein
MMRLKVTLPFNPRIRRSGACDDRPASPDEGGNLGEVGTRRPRKQLWNTALWARTGLALPNVPRPEGAPGLSPGFQPRG